MSWSLNAIGTPEKLVGFLDEHGGKLTGDSRIEFDDAKPHLAALVSMNVNTRSPQVLQLVANGHASKEAGKVTYSTCNVELKSIPGQLV